MVEYRYLVEHHVPKDYLSIELSKKFELPKADVQRSIYHPISFEEDDWQMEVLIDKICA